MTRVIDSLNNSEKIVLSLEITPPDRGKSVDDIFRNIDNLMEFKPGFINVTYHQPHVTYEEQGDCIIRRPTRKKPGTVGICTAIKNRFDVEPVTHLICGGFNKYETEDALIDLHFLEIGNILALRGDPAPGMRDFIPEKDGYTYAHQLVEQIAAMNRGKYIDDLEEATATNFCIGVAAYPEKHYEAVNLDSDLRALKKKVDKGADYIITQMFFDFDIFKNFVEKAREIGITVPIIPGIKPVISRKQLAAIPRNFFVTIPPKVVDCIESAPTPKKAFECGTSYMADFTQKLIDYGVPGLHIFTMGQGRATKAMLERLNGERW